jgi:chemotaxis protein MotA
VCASVFGGFALAGGHLAALFQPLELLMIGGAALGAFIVGNDSKAMKATIRAMPSLFQGSKFTKNLYLNLLGMMFEILSKIRKEGMISIEKDIEDPDQSAIFSKYPNLIKDHHLMEFICDYLRLMLSGSLNAYQIENLMDLEIETHHTEGHIPVHCVSRIGDGLPAFGIVAAVMGVVHTMESVGLPPAELGILIAHALVGTFLGILLAYGFVGPLSTLLEQKLNESSKLLQTVKVIMLAHLQGYAPVVSIEFGRKVLNSTERPGFLELEEHIRLTKSK